MKNLLKILLLLACAYTLSGCRDIHYLLYYPHSLLGAIQTSADRQEFAIPPLHFDKYVYLSIAFTQGDRTVCKNNLSLFHLCSAATREKLDRLGIDYRDQLNRSTEPDDPKLDAIDKAMYDLVMSEPLPDLEMELVTADGEIEIYEPSHAGALEPQKLPYDFHNCNQSAWNHAKLDAGESEDASRYSYAEIDAHQLVCDQSHGKTFVKVRLRSLAGMKIEAIKVENGDSPFAMR